MRVASTPIAILVMVAGVLAGSCAQKPADPGLAGPVVVTPEPPPRVVVVEKSAPPKVVVVERPTPPVSNRPALRPAPVATPRPALGGCSKYTKAVCSLHAGCTWTKGSTVHGTRIRGKCSGKTPLR